MLVYPRLSVLSLILLIGGTMSAEIALVIEPAAIVQIPTQDGYAYQAQRSIDGGPWESFGPWVLGDGNAREMQVPVNEGALYQVLETEIDDLTSELSTLRNQTGVPALAAVVIKEGQFHAMGAVGTRRHGIDAPVTILDQFHHGSITKSITASLAALMVDEGSIDWDTTVGSVFPGKSGGMAAGWAEVTLKQLLANSSGAPGNLSAGGIWSQLWNFEGTPEQGRDLLVDLVTAQSLQFSPGSGYEYSNAGFAIAGAMLETVAGASWEALVAEKLFGPLGMASGGFGVPATPRHLNHPVGHSGNVGAPTIWDPSRDADNPPAIGPAGTVHASIIDLARYVQLHLQGGRGQPGLLISQAGFNQLHSRAYGFDYALGWNVLNRGWAGGDALHHTGSNTQWFTNIWIAPEMNWALIVCMNFGGTDAFAKSDQVVASLLGSHGP